MAGIPRDVGARPSSPQPEWTLAKANAKNPLVVPDWLKVKNDEALLEELRTRFVKSPHRKDDRSNRMYTLEIVNRSAPEHSPPLSTEGLHQYAVAIRVLLSLPQRDNQIRNVLFQAEKRLAKHTNTIHLSTAEHIEKTARIDLEKLDKYSYHGTLGPEERALRR